MLMNRSGTRARVRVRPQSINLKKKKKKPLSALARSQTAAANRRKSLMWFISTRTVQRIMRPVSSVNMLVRVCCVHGDPCERIKTTPLPWLQSPRGGLWRRLVFDRPPFVCELSLKLFKVDKSTAPWGRDAENHLALQRAIIKAIACHRRDH